MHFLAHVPQPKKKKTTLFEKIKNFRCTYISKYTIVNFQCAHIQIQAYAQKDQVLHGIRK